MRGLQSWHLLAVAIVALGETLSLVLFCSEYGITTILQQRCLTGDDRPGAVSLILRMA